MIDITLKREAQSDIAKTVCKLLSREVNVTYNDTAYVAEKVSVTDSTGQNSSKHKIKVYTTN